ncbi:NAD(P)/FAD-dependent oxidoreductase [Nocardia bovistercoris]|uniref:FAD-dependent oxidoreductase n=1 Tax=Nocardia bovistercoris TaxID=2785916 RepID=A0A931I844_9NOCA|nr:FAD-dependent oxidoreductase [Nocardia bovistercoris]MBH0775648.1 FAD-dependent oxidoreductase [Nocardia bovistercoris]
MVQPSTDRTRRVAVIGAGVSGLTAAWALAPSAEVTLYEADDRLGGHADTHEVRSTSGAKLGVDTGFIVHNDRTYPTLLRLFGELGIATQESDMSMSVRCDGCGLEYAGARGLAGLFATPRSLLRGPYLRLLTEVPRFHRLARAELDRPGDEAMTLREFITAAGFSEYFQAHFLTPLVAAVWSCAPTTALRYPARYLFTFLANHGMLTVFGSPTWRTVTGGSATYVRAVAARLDTVLVGTPVRALHRVADGVSVRDAADEVRHFDAAVIATHPAQALALLAEPTEAEREILSAIPYSVNHTLLHTDDSVLPRASRARASWNYRLPSCAARPDRVLVSYDLTRLQRLEQADERRYLVTLGDDHPRAPPPRKAPQTEQKTLNTPAGHRAKWGPAAVTSGGADALVIDRMSYEHPVYTPDSVAAQRRLDEIGDDRVRFAGAYHGWGFHEDGAASGLRAAARLGARVAGEVAAARTS